MKNLTIVYFALLRDLTGVGSEDYQTNAKSFLELYHELKDKYNFPLSSDRIKVALDDEFIPMSENIPEKGKVVFIPPVAGG